MPVKEEGKEKVKIEVKEAQRSNTQGLGATIANIMAEYGDLDIDD